MPACPDVGKHFDADAFTDRICACGVDYVVFPARCNLGMAYYDTALGIRHPSLSFDLLGALADACRRKSIALGAYINVGLSHEEALRHREWSVVSPEGYVYKPDRLDHFFREMCYNSGYGDHVVAMVKELLEGGYGLAGLMMDCMGVGPCVGVECIHRMKEEGVDWRDPEALATFAHASMLRMARRIRDVAWTVRDDLLIYFNGIPFEDQQDLGTYIECECLPTGGWGYETLPVFARYARRLGKPLLNQTGRFHKNWGDFGGIRTEASLEYDCLYGLANAMRVTVGDHFHPRGDMNHAVLDLIGSIYGRLQKLEPWLEKATAVTEIGIVAPPSVFRRGTTLTPCHGFDVVRGATRMFCELKAQFDVLSADMPWDGMQLVVLPDELTLTDPLRAKVQAHLDGNGVLLSSAWSGLDSERREFTCPQWGVTYAGDSPHDPAFFTAEAPLGGTIADMPHNFYGAGVAMHAGPGTEVLARVVAPFYNHAWDGEHGFVYLPPDRVTDQAAVTMSKQVGHISHAVFRAYDQEASVPLRQIVAYLMNRLLPEPLLRVAGMPSFGRATVTAQPGRRMVHLLAYVPERRGRSIDMIEEPVELREVTVSLRTDQRHVSRVYLAPSEMPLAFSVEHGYITTTVPVVPGYAMIVFEQ